MSSSVNKTALVSSALKAAVVGAVAIGGALGGVLLKHHLSKQDSTPPQEEAERAQNKMRYAPENVFPTPPRVPGTPTPEEALKKKMAGMSKDDIERDINRMTREGHSIVPGYRNASEQQLDYSLSKYS